MEVNEIKYFINFHLLIAYEIEFLITLKIAEISIIFDIAFL